MNIINLAVCLLFGLLLSCHNRNSSSISDDVPFNLPAPQPPLNSSEPLPPPVSQDVAPDTVDEGNNPEEPAAGPGDFVRPSVKDAPRDEPPVTDTNSDDNVEIDNSALTNIVTIEDFEDRNPRAGRPEESPWINSPFPRWKHSNNSTFEEVGEHVKSGERAARFSYGPDNGYYQAVLTFDAPQDWTGADLMLVDIYEDRPLHTGFAFVIQLSSSDGGETTCPVSVLPRQEISVVVYLDNCRADSFNRESVSSLLIYLGDPGTAASIYMDNLRIASIANLNPANLTRGLTTALQFGGPGTEQKPGFTFVSDAAPTHAGQGWLSGGSSINWTTLEKGPLFDPLARGLASSSERAKLLLKVEPGAYRVWLVSGGKALDYDLNLNGVYADRITTTGNYNERTYAVTTDTGTIELELTPRLAWGINSIVVFPAADIGTLFTTLRDLKLDLRIGDRRHRAVLAFMHGRQKKLTAAPAPAESARGFITYRASPFMPAGFDSSLPESEILARGASPERMDITALRGERAPLVLNITALEDIADFRATFKPLDAGIPSAAMNVLAAHPYYYAINTTIFPRPRALKNEWPLSIRRGETWTLWFIFHCPKNFPAGNYRARIVLDSSKSGALALTIPVKITVRDLDAFTGSNSRYGTYYTLNVPPNPGAAGEAKFFIDDIQGGQLRNMVGHGLNTIQIVPGHGFTRQTDGTYTYNGMAELDRTVKWYQNAGLKGPFVLYLEPAFGNLSLVMGGSGSLRTEPTGLGAQFYTNVTRACVQFKEYGAAHEWPQLLYYPVDEIEDAAYVRKIYTAVKAAGVRTYSTSVGNYGVRERVDPADSIDVYSGGRLEYLTKERAASIRTIGGEMWSYMPMSDGRNPARLRFIYGVFAWKNGITGIMPWHYLYTNTPDSNMEGEDYYFEYPSLGGQTPTIDWEMYHAAIVDRALMDRLDSICRAATVDDSRRALITEACAYLGSIEPGIPAATQSDEPINAWMHANLPSIRSKLIDYLIRLR